MTIVEHMEGGKKTSTEMDSHSTRPSKRVKESEQVASKKVVLFIPACFRL